MTGLNWDLIDNRDGNGSTFFVRAICPTPPSRRNFGPKYFGPAGPAGQPGPFPSLIDNEKPK